MMVTKRKKKISNLTSIFLRNQENYKQLTTNEELNLIDTKLGDSYTAILCTQQSSF